MTPDRYAEIAKRAYTLWELEGRPAGKALEHWLRAEAEFEAKEPAQTGTSSKPGRPTPKRARRRPHTS